MRKILSRIVVIVSVPVFAMDPSMGAVLPQPHLIAAHLPITSTDFTQQALSSRLLSSPLNLRDRLFPHGFGPFVHRFKAEETGAIPLDDAQGRAINVEVLTPHEREILKELAFGHEIKKIIGVSKAMQSLREKSGLKTSGQKGMAKGYFDLIELTHEAALQGKPSVLEDSDKPDPCLLDAITDMFTHRFRNPAKKQILYQLATGVSGIGIEIQCPSYTYNANASLNELFNRDMNVQRFRKNYRLTARMAALLLRLYRPEAFAEIASPGAHVNNSQVKGNTPPSFSARLIRTRTAWSEFWAEFPKSNPPPHINEFAKALKNGGEISIVGLLKMDNYMNSERQKAEKAALEAGRSRQKRSA
jgi:hypothetical protein